jgi:hypothetical protein
MNKIRRYNMTNIWVECLKNKFRFEFKGLISTEDLFDLTLADLDAIYKSLKKEESDLQGDSLLGNDENPKVREVEVKIEVVKAVFDMKKAEIARAERALANKAQKDKILAIIEDKENQELSEKSIDELREIYLNLE